MRENQEVDPGQVSIIETADGSHTLYNAALDETFHSRKGAVTESKHVFIKEGLGYLPAQAVDILEVGFGTGLNAILALEYAVANQRHVRYVSLEPFPIAAEVIRQLNYESFLEPWLHAYFAFMHNAQWGQAVEVVPGFELSKLPERLEGYTAEPASFDLIFFDAFAPQKQPDMWVEEHFVKLYQALVSGGVLVSYCASGQFKRNLQAAGFIVSKIPGPPGKREMIRAVKP